jgi:DNA-binding NarL/FixJ family response regulator
MNSIRILLADSNYIAKEGLKSIFGSDSELQVIHEVDSGSAMLAEFPDVRPDVVVVDYTSPGFNIQDVKQLMNLHANIAVVAVTEFTHKEQVREAMKVGVNAHIQKDCSHDEIIDSVKAAVNHERFFCGKILDVIGEEHDEFASCDPISLSMREIEIIQMVAGGQTNKQIAEKLCLSSHTVMTHRKNIMNKLGINNTAGLVIYAVKENLIRPNKFLFNN